jgi:hypothetical protein
MGSSLDHCAEEEGRAYWLTPSQLFSSVSAVPEEGYHPTSTSAAEVEY